jgi:hypothetical protein
MSKAYFMVRAELTDPADRPAFDHWYGTEHLPEALDAFRAECAWRCWSGVDPAVHYAFYQFAALEAAQAVLQSPAIRQLAAEFDRAWGLRVTRTRDILDSVQTLQSGTA